MPTVFSRIHRIVRLWRIEWRAARRHGRDTWSSRVTIGLVVSRPLAGPSPAQRLSTGRDIDGRRRQAALMAVDAQVSQRLERFLRELTGVELAADDRPHQVGLRSWRRFLRRRCGRSDACACRATAFGSGRSRCKARQLNRVPFQIKCNSSGREGSLAAGSWLPLVAEAASAKLRAELQSSHHARRAANSW